MATNKKIIEQIENKMLFIEGGTFQMGSKQSEEEQPIHKVQIPSFHLGRYAVTVEEYLHFAEETRSNFPEWMEEGSKYNIYTGTDEYYKQHGTAINNKNHPIVGVSWDNVQSYCAWLTQETSKSYRLSSEVEWEYAARGGKHQNPYLYSGSNHLKEVGWYYKNSHGTIKAIGQKLPNRLGLYDMSGNVWEWCEDHWHDSYKGAPKDGSAWLDQSKNNRLRVLRGGSWSNVDNDCRVSSRYGHDHDFRDGIVGFRVSRY